MAHNVEPMDIDDIVSDFDNKENTFQHSNVLVRTPSTEKGYEELDVSELNMKLRNSITPANSSMSKSYTANCVDNRNLDPGEDPLNNIVINENGNLTCSLNFPKTEKSKVAKALPLQSLPTDQLVSAGRSSSVLRSRDSSVTNDKNKIMVTVTDVNNIDANISYSSIPSSSSSHDHTPESTTPTTEIPKHDDGGSPIMRGLKSVLNMFRSSQSPIPPDDEKKIIPSPVDVAFPDYEEEEEAVLDAVISSTPLATEKKQKSNKDHSPHRESQIFNEDLEKELHWNEDSTIFFPDEKIPIHKLFFQQGKSKKEKNEKLDATVEYMDISYNNSVLRDKTMTETQDNKSCSIAVDSDSEFVDCETTLSKNDTTDIVSHTVNKNTSIASCDQKTASEASIPNVPVPSNETHIYDSEVDRGSYLSAANFATHAKHTNDSNTNLTPKQENDDSQHEQLGLNAISTMTKNSISNSNATTAVFCTDENKSLVVGVCSLDAPNATCHNERDNTSKQEIVDLKHDQLYLNVTSPIIENATPLVLNENIHDNASALSSVFIPSSIDMPMTELNAEATKITAILQKSSHTDEMQEHKNITDLVSESCQRTQEKFVEKQEDNETSKDSNKKYEDKLDHILESLPSYCESSEKFDATNNNYAVVANLPLLSVNTSNKNDTQAVKPSITQVDILNSEKHSITTAIRSETMVCSTLDEVPAAAAQTECNQEMITGVDSLKSHNELSTQKCGLTCTIETNNLPDMLTTPAAEMQLNELSDIKESPVIEKTMSLNSTQSIVEKSYELNNAVQDNIEVFQNVEKSTETETDLIKKEIHASENKSSYSPVTASGDTFLQSLETITEYFGTTDGDFINPIATNTKLMSPPTSPKIVSKGYNFNFDEIDDPFATKTKIRQSPPPEGMNHTLGENKVSDGFQKRDIKNQRRKSQPFKIKPTKVKRKFNATFDSTCEIPIDKRVDVVEPLPSYQIIEDVPNTDPTLSGFSEITTLTTDETKFPTDRMLTKINTQLDAVELPAQQNIEEKSNIISTDERKVVSNHSAASPAKEENNFCIDSVPTKTDTEFSSSVGDFNITQNVNIQPPTDTSSSLNNGFEPFYENKSQNCPSSSEQSIGLSAGVSSTEFIEQKNTFNLPEIDSILFNLFTTKTKIRCSPDVSMESSEPVKTAIESKEDILEELSVEETPVDISNMTCSSKTTDEKDATVQEVHTDNDDTVEGPFLEADDFDDKMSDFKEDVDDMMKFSYIPTQPNDDNVDAGEMFIDAEAFEFLLNQNQSSAVCDSGKESLFLKFDPLFAKRVSSDGVAEALNKFRNRQRTPKKSTQPSNHIDDTAHAAGPSKMNITYEGDTHNIFDESNDELNITVSKPMMVVTPAVNPVATPRNKTINNSIRYTSPAVAVIDRLLSMSINNSLIGHDTSVANIERETQETELVLIQLRDMLADKKKYNKAYRDECETLKDRLSVAETQLKGLEDENMAKLKIYKELEAKLIEVTEINNGMASVVEKYERTIATLIAETEQVKKQHAEERKQLIKERDEQTAHLTSMEISFNDLHSKYEKSKQIILTYKSNEEACLKSIKDFEENYDKIQKNYESLKQHATSKLNHANEELEKINRTHQSEMLKLNAMIKRRDVNISSLEETLAQKTKANEELTAICDELINKVG